MELKNFENYIGHDIFVWWFGVVESRSDPLNLGRCKIRIFGTHTEDLSKLPTQDLPWALPIYPPGQKGSFSAPEPGDYVFGFFSDGMSKQAPIYIGITPGIPQKDITYAEQRGFTANAQVYSVTAAERGKVVDVDIRPIVYSDTPAMRPVQEGKPTTPAVAYTYFGTGIEKSDNNREHVCDIANKIRFENALQELKNWEIFKTIRTAIEAVTDSTSGSPLVTQVVSAIKMLRAYARMIKQVIDFVNNVILEIAAYIAYIRTMINWILSLPVELLNMLQNCLSELYSALTSAVSLNTPGTESIMGQILGLYNDVSAAVQSAITVEANAQSTAQSAKALLDPSTYRAA